ncbi:hypothetical protein [Paraburkholderia sp. UYCP14C]|nr:hypothetical protein [Paraburkholderia sp. UYCP14C]
MRKPWQPVPARNPDFGWRLRRLRNETLLAMYEDGTYERIYGKWFSQGK